MKNVIILTDFSDAIMTTRIGGPYKVAHILRELGIRVTVINWLHMWSYKDLIKFLDQLIDNDTLFIGVHNLYYKDIEGQEITNPDTHVRLKAVYPGALIPHGKALDEEFFHWLKQRNQTLVLGGPTANDRDINQRFDYILSGYTEKSLVNFVDHLTTGAKLTHSYRSLFGPTIVQDINTQEKFDYASTVMKWHDDDCVLPGETLNIEIARGCIFKCSFCYYPMIGKKKFDYIRHQKIIRDELVDNYQRFGVTRYVFTDETFNDSKHKIQLIEEIAQELPFQLEYFAWARLDLIMKNPDTIEMLARSGLRYAHYGIETLNPRSGKAIGKNFTEKKVTDTLNMITDRSQGQIRNHGTFIIGLPHSSKEEIRDLYQKLESGAVPCSSFNFFGLRIFKPSAPAQSEFTKTYAQHGYWELLPNDPIWGEQVQELAQQSPDTLPWANKYMNYFEAVELQHELEKDANRFRHLIPTAELSIASLGLDRSQWYNKKFNEMDWHYIRTIKVQRFHDYQKLMYSRLLSNAH